MARTCTRSTAPWALLLEGQAGCLCSLKSWSTQWQVRFWGRFRTANLASMLSRQATQQGHTVPQGV